MTSSGVGKPQSPAVLHFLKGPLVKCSLAHVVCVSGAPQDTRRQLSPWDQPRDCSQPPSTSRPPGGQQRGQWVSAESRAQEMGRQGHEPPPSPLLSTAQTLRPPSISAPPHGHPCTSGLLGGALSPLSPAPGWGRPACTQRPARVRRPLCLHSRALLTALPFQARSGAERLGLAGDLLS